MSVATSPQDHHCTSEPRRARRQSGPADMPGRANTSPMVVQAAAARTVRPVLVENHARPRSRLIGAPVELARKLSGTEYLSRRFGTTMGASVRVAAYQSRLSDAHPTQTLDPINRSVYHA